MDKKKKRKERLLLVCVFSAAILASACGSDSPEIDAAPPNDAADEEQTGTIAEDQDTTRDVPSTSAPISSSTPETTVSSIAATTTTSVAPATTTTVINPAVDCVLDTTDGAIAGIENGTDIVTATTTLVEQCGLPDYDSGWGWSCRMGGPDWDGPEEPERTLMWGNLSLTFWRQPQDLSWDQQQLGEIPTYSDSGALTNWLFSDAGEDRVILDVQEAGISFGTPLDQVAQAVGVGERPDKWYEDSFEDPWSAYVDNVLSVFGLLDFTGGNGLVFAGQTSSFSPATFEDALAGAELSYFGMPAFCD